MSWLARTIGSTVSAARRATPHVGSATRRVPTRSASSSASSSNISGRNKALLVLLAAGGSAAAYTLLGTPVAADSGASGRRVGFPASSGKLTGERIVSLAELEKHVHEGSLWVCIDGTVYDVTDFIMLHPGGAKVLLQNAGKDVTQLFHAIHPADTLEKNASQIKIVGRLDDVAMARLRAAKSDEDKKIEAARAALFGVDSVVSVDDFERYAKDCLPTHAWAYYSTGADTEDSLAENAAAFTRVFFRPRVMRNVVDVSTATTLLGVPVSMPVYVSPTARNGLGNPEGEAAVARGAGAAGILQVLSHYASRSLEEVKAAAREGQEIGWQLYLSPDREKSAQAVRDAVAAGAHSIWITADTTVLGKREVERRIGAELDPAPHGKPLTREPFTYAVHEMGMSWADIDWVRQLAPGLPVVVKGIGAWEDVVLAYRAGADAVVLSNHGGRQLNYAEAPLRTLADVQRHAPGVLKSDRFSVFIDGGVRHGTDVLKALCLGAKGVGLGRPFIYATSAWGAEGVEKLCMILQEEIDIGMRLLGVTSVDQLGPEYLDISRL